MMWFTRGTVPPAARWSAALLIGCGLLAALPVRAMDGNDVQIRGTLDVTESNRGKPLDSNRTNLGFTPFDPYRLRLFLDGQTTPGLQIYTQFLMDDNFSPRVYGAYAMWTPHQDRDLHVLIGKIPWLLGTYAPRTYSDKKPLIGTPLMWYYHTTLRYDAMPPSVDALLAVSGTGQYGTSYAPSQVPRKGVPVLYDACWDVGLALNGSARPFEYAVSMVNGSPSMMESDADNNTGKSFLGRIGLQAGPAIRVGVSASYGPWLSESFNPSLPPGKTANDYHQTAVVGDAELLAGRFEMHAEGVANEWETPTVGNLDVASYYVEGRLGVTAGGWVAARWEQMRFGDVTSSAGVSQPWDYDIDRLETGLGYRFTRGVIGKLVYQRTVTLDPDDVETLQLYAAQMIFSF